MDLLERDEPLQALEARLAQARGGHGALTLVTGEAGIGKTSVVQAFAGRHEGDARVMWSWCDALSTPQPLGPLYDLAKSAGGDLAQAMAGEASRHERFTAFLNALSAPPGPVVAIIEDLHWADEATVDLLVHVARRIGDTYGHVIATYRDDDLPAGHPLPAALGRIVPLRAVDRLHLPRLSEQAVARLAPPDVDVTQIHRLTSGNPYFVVEMLAAGAAGVPPTVRDVVLARVMRLSPAARSTVDAVAVVPDRADVALIRDVTGQDGTGIEECEAIGLLECHGRRVAFRHELARLTVAQAIPAARAVDLHAAVLRSLAGRPGVDVARLAYHADQAGDDVALARYAATAAAQAMRLGAYRSAAEHCARALRAGRGQSTVQRAELLEVAAVARGRSGRIDEAVASYEQAEQAWRLAGRIDRVGMAMACRSQFLWALGQTALAHEVGNAAITLLEGRPVPAEGSPGVARATVYTYGAYLRMLARDLPGAIELGNRAATLAERHEQTALLSKALNVVGTCLWFTDPVRASQTMRRSLEVARASGDDQTIGLALGNWGSAAIEVRRYAEGDRMLREDLEWCAQRDLDIGRDYSRAWLARSAFEQGDWATARHIAGELGAQPQENLSTATVVLTVSAQVDMRRGEPGAETALERAWELASRSADPPRLWPIAAARAEAAWLAGRAASIPDLIAETYEMACRLRQPWAVGELGYWLWRAGALSAAPPGSAPPYAQQVDGDWRGAAAAWDGIGCPYEAALARADGDDPAELLEALRSLLRLGARPAADLVRRRLRQLGVRRLPALPRQATRANPGGLTDRELQVLCLVADGLSNAAIAARLHISRRTADHHVAAILVKLGVRDRHAAVRVARERGLTTGV